MKTETIPHDLAQSGGSFANYMPFTIKPTELNRLLHRGDRFAIADVREPEDFACGHIPGAINLPRDQWPTVEGLRRHGVNVVYCDSEVSLLATLATCEFARKGYLVVELEGGFEAWKDNRLSVEK